MAASAMQCNLIEFNKIVDTIGKYLTQIVI